MVAAMKRYFNTEGICRPNVHYMVNLDARLKEIKERYVDRGSYFIINRGRQYGKTTTLRELSKYLKEDYTVVSLDFQGIGSEEFVDADRFSKAFARLFIGALDRQDIGDRDRLIQYLEPVAGAAQQITLSSLFAGIGRLCEACAKPVVMMIDEVDSASNNQVFIDFLAMLRQSYLDREDVPTFHSVILAGVYDIKNLKLKIRPDEEHQYNSPWNIAAKFNVDMSFSTNQIAVMLQEYENEHQTGMNVCAVAKCIYDYTSGYPYLVSAICKLLDEEIPAMERFANRSVWTKEGFRRLLRLF